MKCCLREPIPEIYQSARFLDAAVSAHQLGKIDLAKELFYLANDPVVWAWTDSVWGKNSSYVVLQPKLTMYAGQKIAMRMPTIDQKRALIKRDGFHCRFCGIPVIRAEVRKHLNRLYPDVVPWGRTNKDQHAGFQCMWLQFDHVVPHSEGGTNELDNLVITCAACNYGKMQYSLEQLSLIDPRSREPAPSLWDGLERLFI